VHDRDPRLVERPIEGRLEGSERIDALHGQTEERRRLREIDTVWGPEETIEADRFAPCSDRQEGEDSAAIVVEHDDRERQRLPPGQQEPREVVQEREVAGQEHAAAGTGGGHTERGRGHAVDAARAAIREDPERRSAGPAEGVPLMRTLRFDSVGGASGPLYGTFFMRSGMALASKEELNDEDLFKMLKTGVEGIVQRGRAQLEDKTMFDAWSPALDAMQAALDNGQNTHDALKAAVDAAEQGMKNTIPLIARKGRASYLGERSRGHQDPGATSSYLMLNALLDTLENE